MGRSCAPRVRRAEPLTPPPSPATGFHTEEDGTPGVLRELRLQQASGALGYTGVLFPVHRLDKVTSGALLLAKSREAAGELATAFRERRVAKFYVAIADKKPKKAQGTVKGDMARTRRAAWRLLRECTRPAVTQFVSAPYREDEAGPGCEGGAPLRLFVMKPLTGRTHQACCPLSPRTALYPGRALALPPPSLSSRGAPQQGSLLPPPPPLTPRLPAAAGGVALARGADRGRLPVLPGRRRRRGPCLPPRRGCPTRAPPARTKLHEAGAVGTSRLHEQPDRAARWQRCGCRCAGGRCRWWFRRGTRVGGASPTRGCARRSAVPVPSHLHRVSLQYNPDADPAPA